jgi:hypothetical protein
MPPLLDKTTDQRIVHHGTWEQFKFIQKGFEGSPGVRLFYYDGAIEILMPGQDHETFARVIGYLVTTFLVEQGIFFKPTGEMTSIIFETVAMNRLSAASYPDSVNSILICSDAAF